MIIKIMNSKIKLVGKKLVHSASFFKFFYLCFVIYFENQLRFYSSQIMNSRKKRLRILIKKIVKCMRFVREQKLFYTYKKIASGNGKNGHQIISGKLYFFIAHRHSNNF